MLSIHKGTKAEHMIHVLPMVMMGYHGAVQMSIHLPANILKDRLKHFVQMTLVTLITAQLGSILSQTRKHATRFLSRLLPYSIKLYTIISHLIVSKKIVIDRISDFGTDSF